MPNHTVRPRLRCRPISVHPHRDGRLHALCRWIAAQQGRAILYIDGRPTAVLMDYAAYNRLERLRTEEIKGQLLAHLRSLAPTRRAAPTCCPEKSRRTSLTRVPPPIPRQGRDV